MGQNKLYSLTEIRDIINEHRNFLKEKYFVDDFYIFGSYAKNCQTPKSDIDLLVKFSKTIDMFEFIDLEEYLSKIFDKKIDLGTPNSLKKFVKNDILKGAIKL